MYKTAMALLVAALVAVPAISSEKTDVMAVVHQWIDGFNKGDVESALATCADEVSIIDDIAPYEWHGSGACTKWFDAFNAWTSKDGITDANVVPGKRQHVDVDGAHAY